MLSKSIALRGALFLDSSIWLTISWESILRHKITAAWVDSHPDHERKRGIVQENPRSALLSLHKGAFTRRVHFWYATRFVLWFWKLNGECDKDTNGNFPVIGVPRAVKDVGSSFQEDARLI